MSKMFSVSRLQCSVGAALFTLAAAPTAYGATHFGVAVAANDALIISSSSGLPAAEIAAPCVARSVTVDGASFDVSYGRDENNSLTAVLTPTMSESGGLHFEVSRKNIDAAEHAVVTLTFSADRHDVTVDPGTTGTVAVDSKTVVSTQPVADSLVADASAEAPAATKLNITEEAPVQTTDSVESNQTPAAPSVSTVSTTAAPALLPNAPATIASSLTSPLDHAGAASPFVQSASVVAPVAVAKSEKTGPPQRLFWAPPITGPDGVTPAIESDQIKLVDVQGTVSVVTPDGRQLAGTEGMIVPTGSTIATNAKSVAALFIGGVDSARMMPKCQLTMTQELANGIRKVTVNLSHGAVFSRIGKRAGETEDYEVVTAEGTQKAAKPVMLTYRGTYQDLRPETAMNFAFDRHHLLAWNPAPLAPGLISDVADSIIAADPPYPATFTYYPGAKISYAPYTESQIDTIIAQGKWPQFTSPQNTFSSPKDNAVNILQAILIDLVPYNEKMQDLIYRVNSGTGTPGDVAYYNNLVSTFFNTQKPAIIAQYPNNQASDDAASSAALKSDIANFGTNAATPY